MVWLCVSPDRDILAYRLSPNNDKMLTFLAQVAAYFGLDILEMSAGVEVYFSYL